MCRGGAFPRAGRLGFVADIVGAAAAIARLQASWSVSVLPLGRGRVRSAHGWIPVPAPATASLLEGYAFMDDGLEGERVTPTGAAILSHLAARQDDRGVRGRLLASGSGFGTRTFPGLSNVLRLLAFETAQTPQVDGSDRVAVLAFEIDDQSPEDLAIGLDQLRETPGVLDVLQMPAFGKKGRMSMHVQVLATPERIDEVTRAIFAETTTLACAHLVARRILSREQMQVSIGEHTLRVKVAARGSLRTAKVESDDLRAAAHGRVERERMRRAAEDEESSNG